MVKEMFTSVLNAQSSCRCYRIFLVIVGGIHVEMALQCPIGDFMRAYTYSRCTYGDGVRWRRCSRAQPSNGAHRTHTAIR